MRTPGLSATPRTLFEKLWAAHEVARTDDGQSLIAIDRIFLHERTGTLALQALEKAGRTIRHPGRTFCVMDHIVDTKPGRPGLTRMPGGAEFITATREAAREAGIRLFDIDDPSQGIVHVISPELGIALPGLTLVCPDSHTCTVGGLGALAWGIGTTQAEHALATGTLRVEKPLAMRVNFVGPAGPGGHGQGPDPGGDRETLGHGRPGLRGGVRGRCDRCAGRGRTHDALQHGHRVRRLDRHGGAQRGRVRIREQARVFPAGRVMGPGAGGLARSEDRRRGRSSTANWNSTAKAWRRR